MTVEPVRHRYAAPTATLVTRDGRRLDTGAIVAWWTADLVVHALAHRGHASEPPVTRCGWPADWRAIPLGHALAIARPCHVCWRVSEQLTLELEELRP